MPAGLGGDDQLVTVRGQVLGEDAPEVLLGRTEGRAVVVGEVELGDAQVEGGADDGPLPGEGRVVTEVVPEPQGDGRQLQAAVADVAEPGGGIAVLCGPVVWLQVFGRDPRLLTSFAFGVGL